MGKKFVVLTKEDFENTLPESWEVVPSSAKEIIYSIPTPNDSVTIRIFSTVDIRTNQTRDKGADAIRIVYWDIINDRPVGKGKKILRVEGTTTISDRIGSRVAEFVNSALDQNIIDFKYVKAVLSSKAVDWMGFAQSLLKGLEQYGSLTDNQLAYVLGETNPKGKPTMEKIAKEKDPDFLEKYLESLVDEALEISSGKKEEMEAEVESITEKKEEKSKKEVSEKDVNGVEQESKELVLTSTYTDWKYPFEAFNPVQSQVMPHRVENKNMVLSCATSSGKTIAAELLMDWVMEHGVEE